MIHNGLYRKKRSCVNRYVARPGVGGHLHGICRFWFDSLDVRATPHRDARGLQVAADRLSPDAGGLLDARKGPAQAPQRTDLLLLFLVVQDIPHAGDGTCIPRPRQRLGPSQLIAGFEVSCVKNALLWSAVLHQR